MKIDFLVAKDIVAGGGIERYTREVGRRLVSRGHKVRVFSTSHSKTSIRSLDGMEIMWLPKLGPVWTEKLAAASVAALRELFSRRPDIFHLHSVAAGATAGILRLRTVPCVVQMHGIEWQRSRWPALGRKVLLGLEQLSFHGAQAFTAVSNVQCKYYSRTYGVPVRFIPTAANIKVPVEPRLIQAQNFKPHKYVLSACRLVAEKGIHYLIEAFRRLSTDWHLVIAGDDTGNEAYGSKLRRLAGDDPRIHFTGYVSGRLLDELFSNAGIYAQPSEVEGLAIALLEGMSFGLPCLVSDIPENQEAIADTGLTFENRNVGDLARKLAWLIENRVLADELGQRARTRIAQQFTWEHVTNELETFYSETIEQFAQHNVRFAHKEPVNL